MPRLGCCAVLAGLAWLLAPCLAQSYTVLAPDTVRPNTNYFAAISVADTQGELQDVECRILGRTAAGRAVEIVERSRVPPGATQLVRLAVGELGAGDYRSQLKSYGLRSVNDCSGSRRGG